MEFEVNARIPLRCDCGHQFEIPFARLDEQFECPACGSHDRLSDEQIGRLRADFEQKVAALGTEQVRKATSDMLARSTRGLKNVKYTPKGR